MRQKFIEIFGNNRVLFDEPMSQHTTFRIGGPADVFVMPENYEQIKKNCAPPRGSRYDSVLPGHVHRAGGIPLSSHMGFYLIL